MLFRNPDEQKIVKLTNRPGIIDFINKALVADSNYMMQFDTDDLNIYAAYGTIGLVIKEHFFTTVKKETLIKLLEDFVKNHLLYLDAERYNLLLITLETSDGKRHKIFTDELAKECHEAISKIIKSDETFLRYISFVTDKSMDPKEIRENYFLTMKFASTELERLISARIKRPKLISSAKMEIDYFKYEIKKHENEIINLDAQIEMMSKHTDGLKEALSKHRADSSKDVKTSDESIVKYQKDVMDALLVLQKTIDSPIVNLREKLNIQVGKKLELEKLLDAQVKKLEKLEDLESATKHVRPRFGL